MRKEMNSKYDFMTSPAPMGSMSFIIPEKKNTKPKMKPQKRFSLRRRFIIYYRIMESTTAWSFSKMASGGSISPFWSAQSTLMNLGSISHCFL